MIDMARSRWPQPGMSLTTSRPGYCATQSLNPRTRSITDATPGWLIESPRILVTSVVSKRRHMLRKNYQDSLKLPVPAHIYVILSMSG